MVICKDFMWLCSGIIYGSSLNQVPESNEFSRSVFLCQCLRQPLSLITVYLHSKFTLNIIRVCVLVFVSNYLLFRYSPWPFMSLCLINRYSLICVWIVFFSLAFLCLCFLCITRMFLIMLYTCYCNILMPLTILLF